jgi:hypothetical protein
MLNLLRKLHSTFTISVTVEIADSFSIWITILQALAGKIIMSAALAALLRRVAGWVFSPFSIFHFWTPTASRSKSNIFSRKNYFIEP